MDRDHRDVDFSTSPPACTHTHTHTHTHIPPHTGVCCLAYFLASTIIQLIVSYIEQDTILTTQPHATLAKGGLKVNKTHIHTYIHTHIHMDMHIHTYIHTCTHTYIYT
jgi:hypothetical protein